MGLLPQCLAQSLMPKGVLACRLPIFDALYGGLGLCCHGNSWRLAP